MQDEPEHDVRRYWTYMAALLFVVVSIVLGTITRLFDKRDEWHIADSLSGLLIFLALLTIVLGELLLPPD